jgi:post-segregation antitoxin (ccd killing protein)
MSKKSKNIARVKRLGMKRAKKEAQQRQYQAWAEEGRNNMSKRAKLRNKRGSSLRTKKHPQPYCGNYGCKKCHPEFNTPAYAMPGSFLYKRKFMRRAK